MVVCWGRRVGGEGFALGIWEARDGMQGARCGMARSLMDGGLTSGLGVPSDEEGVSIGED